MRRAIVLLNIFMLMMLPRQEYEDDEEEYYYYDYEPESSCPPGELKVQVFFCLLLLFPAVIVEMDSIWMDTGRFKSITEEEEV